MFCRIQAHNVHCDYDDHIDNNCGPDFRLRSPFNPLPYARLLCHLSPAKSYDHVKPLV